MLIIDSLTTIIVDYRLTTNTNYARNEFCSLKFKYQIKYRYV